MKEFFFWFQRKLWVPWLGISLIMPFSLIEQDDSQLLSNLIWVIAIIGIAFLALAIYSLGLIAQDRGRSRWWSLLALAGVWGVIGVYCMRTAEELEKSRSQHA